MNRLKRVLPWIPFCALLISLATAFAPGGHTSGPGLVGCEFIQEDERADTTGQGSSCPTGPEH